MGFSNYIIMEDVLINFIELTKNNYPSVCNKEYTDLVTNKCIDISSGNHFNNCKSFLHNYNMCMNASKYISKK